MAEILGPDGRPIPRPELRSEVATLRAGRDITRGYVDTLPYIPPQDRVLRYQGAAAYEVYEQLLQDDRVYATLAQRRAAVVAKETEVVPGGKMRRDKMAADFIRETLDHIRWDTVTDRMLYGVFYGYSVAEAMWARDGRYVALDQLRVRNRRRFVFDVDFNLRLLTTDNPNGETLPERKFWHFATGADHDDEPYGRGLAHWLYWPVWFKKNQIKFWLVFLEKFGQPTVAGKYRRNATEDERRKLHQALEAIHADAVVFDAGRHDHRADRGGALRLRGLRVVLRAHAGHDHHGNPIADHDNGGRLVAVASEGAHGGPQGTGRGGRRSRLRFVQPVCRDVAHGVELSGSGGSARASPDA